MRVYDNYNGGDNQELGDYVDIYKQPEPEVKQQQVNYANPSMNPNYTNPSMSSINGGNGAVNVAPKENVLMGIIGALLFGLAGGVLHFIIYQIGFIAYLCGVVIFVLPFMGYTKFSKGASVKGLVISFVISVVIVFLSEYTSLAFLIYSKFADTLDVTFFEAFRAAPAFISALPKVKAAFIKDLVILYIAGIVGFVGMIKKK